MKKILVMIPAAGEVYDHDCVRAYHYRNVQANVDRYYNMGDLFVYDSSLKLLQFDQIEPLKISQFSQKHIDRYNAEFDYCFLRGSNYIHPYMNWEQAIPVLQKLKIPVIPFGIGAQSPAHSEIPLSEETKTVLKILADKCASVGIRGFYTAEVLNKIGIQNIDIIGCPTLYRFNNPTLQIALPPLEKIETIGYTLRREVDQSYSISIENYMQVQREMIFELGDRFNLTLIAQGEREEKVIFYKQQEKISQAIDNLVFLKWFKDENDPLLDLYLNRMFYSEIVSDYDDFTRKLDLVLGYRLHGNLMALANQTPAIYCSYDSRTREFADTYKIPCYDVDSKQKFVLEDYYRQDLFNQFNQSYQHYYRAMSEFLTKNGMSHKMQLQVA
ncbi:MAG: polysaccharide pyruvyl transferase family protein [Cyanobacteria bacterium CRU_2_1]|nr:polysaccharide pyruvyl transferase family protein [Cyanobacteria bacterium CRU_2_1]